MKTATLLASALVLGAASTRAMAAEDGMKVEKPIRVLVGIFSPKESGLEKNWTAVGVGYDVQKTKATNPLVYGVFVDYATKKKDGVTVSSTGIGVSGRFYLESANASGKPYAVVGVGNYSGKATFGGVSTTKSKVGFKAGLGYELSNGFLGEVSYNAVKLEGTDFGGTSFRVGFRF